MPIGASLDVKLGLTATAGVELTGHFGLTEEADFSGDAFLSATPSTPTVVGIGSIGFKLGGQVLIGPGAGTFGAGVVVGVGGELNIMDATFGLSSAEYPEYVRSTFNDTMAMAVFVNGQNCATVPGAAMPVSINTINASSSSQYFLDNDSGAGYPTSMDGMTEPLECAVAVQVGQPVTVKIVVADGSDEWLDSAVTILDRGIWADGPPLTCPGDIAHAGRDQALSRGPGAAANPRARRSRPRARRSAAALSALTTSTETTPQPEADRQPRHQARLPQRLPKFGVHRRLRSLPTRARGAVSARQLVRLSRTTTAVRATAHTTPSRMARFSP